jgi:hypothetical protein
MKPRQRTDIETAPSNAPAENRNAFGRKALTFYRNNKWFLRAPAIGAVTTIGILTLPGNVNPIGNVAHHEKVVVNATCGHDTHLKIGKVSVQPDVVLRGRDDATTVAILPLACEYNTEQDDGDNVAIWPDVAHGAFPGAVVAPGQAAPNGDNHTNVSISYGYTGAAIFDSPEVLVDHEAYISHNHDEAPIVFADIQDNHFRITGITSDPVS